MLELNRCLYKDLIIDESEIEVVNDEVCLSKEGDISVCLEEYQVNDLDNWKEMLLVASKNIPLLDNAAQMFIEGRGESMNAEIGCIFMDDKSTIRIDYWCIDVNSQFDVVFNIEEGKINMTQFGTLRNLFVPVITNS